MLALKKKNPIAQNQNRHQTQKSKKYVEDMTLKKIAGIHYGRDAIFDKHWSHKQVY